MVGWAGLFARIYALSTLGSFLRVFALPKGTDLSFYGPGMLDNIAAELNARPRKRHEFHTRRSPQPTTLRSRKPTRCCVTN